MSTDNEKLLPPLLSVTNDDHGAWVTTVSTLLLILTILIATITLISRIRVLRLLTSCDAAIATATFLLLPQTVCINLASSNGLGQHLNALSDSSFQSYSKYLYASQILSIIVLACSKTAVAILVLSLKPMIAVRLACKVAMGVTATWAIAAIVALAVQCKPPEPWDFRPGRCVNQEALYIILAVCHIVLDLVVIGLPIAMMWNVQISEAKRRQICGLFALRIIVPAITIVGLVSLQPYFHSTPLDQPWNAVMPAIWSQLMLSLSIVCSCIPSLKRVLVDLQTGMMAGTVSDFFELSVSGGHGNNTNTLYGSGGNYGSKSGYGMGSVVRSGNDTKKGDRDPPSMNFKTRVERSDSLQNLRDNAILQTIDYEVKYERNQDRTRASSSSHDVISDHSDGWSVHHPDRSGTR